MPVYLLHFARRYKHAGHYLGYTHDLEARIRAHRLGQGARLMEVIARAGIPFVVARTWEGGRDLEEWAQALPDLRAGGVDGYAGSARRVAASLSRVV